MTLYPIELIRDILAPAQTKPLSRSPPSRTFGKLAREFPGTFRIKTPAASRAAYRKPNISGGQ